MLLWLLLSMNFACSRLEDEKAKDGQTALRNFDSRLAGGVEALRRSGRWAGILESGGSPKELLGRPSPPVQVWLFSWQLAIGPAPRLLYRNQK